MAGTESSRADGSGSVLRAGLVGLLLLATAQPLAAAPACQPVPAAADRCEAWAGAYNHPGGRGGRGEDIGRDVAAAADGRVFLVGVSLDDVTRQDAAIAAFDADGTALWSRRKDGHGQYDTFSSVAFADATDRVIGTGRSTGPDGTWDWQTTAYAAGSGEELWTVRHTGGPGVDALTWSVATSPDGETAYVAGQVGGDHFVVAYDSADGSELWNDRYDGPAGAFDQVNDIDVAADGRIFVTGESDGPGTGRDAATAAYAPDGTRLWLARFDGGGRRDDVGQDVAVSRDGSKVAVASRSAGQPGASVNNWDIVIVVYDSATGALLWSNRWDGGRAADDVVAGIAFSPDGDRVYTGGTTSREYPALNDYVPLAHDAATGVRAWEASHSTPYSETATGLAVTSDGDRIVLTGYWLFPRGELQPVFKIEPAHTLTVAFDPAGARVWTARHTHSGVGADVGVAIAAAPTGRRVHTGGTFVTSGVYVYPTDFAHAYAYDMGTVAYDA